MTNLLFFSLSVPRGWSRLMVVALLPVTAISTDMMPQDKTIHDRDEVMSVAHGVFIPAVRPVICSLCNKDGKGPSGESAGKA